MASHISKPPINMDYFEDLTGDIPTSKETSTDQIGDKIKQLRKNKGLSISELSKLTGFEEQILQEIEANTISPQLGTIIKLSKALDSALCSLIAGEGCKNYSITRKNESKVISRSTSQRGQQPAYTYMSLAPEVKGRHMEALIVQLEELPDKERSMHAGEEFIYVLHGKVVLNIGDDRFILESGDSAYYQSTTPHLLTAQQGQAEILAVIYDE